MLGLCPDDLELAIQIQIGDLYVRADLGDLGNHVQVLTGATNGRYWVVIGVRSPLFCRTHVFRYFVADIFIYTDAGVSLWNLF